MKKGKLILFISVLVVSLEVIALVLLSVKASKPEIEIFGEQSKYGQESYFVVSAKNFDKDVAAFDITLSFDPSLVQILEVSKGSLGEEVVATREAYANKNGEITLLYLDYTGGDEVIDIDGDIAYIRYKLLKPSTGRVDFTKVNVVEANGYIKDNVRMKGFTVG